MGLFRILFALSVLISHSFPILGNTIVGRDAAVRGFFIISGFYMALILNEKYIKKNGSYKLFITNRLLRIYPIYWVVLILYIIFAYFYFYHNLYIGSFSYYIDLYQHHKSSLFISGNISDIVRDFTIIIRNDYLTLNPNNSLFLLIGQAWTLVMELLFYICAPFIVRRNYKVIVILITISLSIRFVVFSYLMHNNLPITDRFFPSEIVFFLLGVLSYKIYNYLKNTNIKKNIYISIYALLLFSTVFYNNIPFSYSFRWIDFKVWAYLFLLMLSIPLIFKFVNKNRFDHAIGELSYPIYISHLFVFMVLINLNILKSNDSNSTIILFVITVIFSQALVVLIDNPVDRWRQSRLYRKTRNR